MNSISMNSNISYSNISQIQQLNINSLNKSIMFKKVNKISLNILLSLDSEKEVINLYCKNLECLINIYEKSSILVTISKMLKDRAKDWFVANILLHLTRESIISWIIALKIIFSMNSNAWDIVQDKKYDSSSDNLVMNYFYDKINI